MPSRQSLGISAGRMRRPIGYDIAMLHFQNQTLEMIVYIGAAVVLLVIGYQVGRSISRMTWSRVISSKAT